MAKAWKGAALVLLLAAASIAAPVREKQPEGDLGESESVSEKMPPTETESEGLEIMEEGLKLWKKGETKNGGESLTKLNDAYGKLEEKQFAKSAARAEHVVEEAVISSHAKHPRQIAKDTAIEVERGLKMATRYTGDDIGVFESGVRKSESRAKKAGGGKIPQYGKHVEKEMNKGIKLSKKGMATQSRMAHFKQNHPNQFKSLESVATQATSDAPPADALAAFKKVLKGPQKKGGVTAEHAEAEAKEMKDAVNKASAVKKTSLLQFAESDQPPVTFSLQRAPVVDPRLRPLVNKDAVKTMANRNHIDQSVLQAMRHAESKLNTELAAIEPADMRPVKTLNDPLDRTLSATSGHMRAEEDLIKSLKVPPLALLQVAADFPEPTPPKTFDPFTQNVPVTYKLPAAPLGNVEGKIQQDMNSELQSQELMRSFAKAAVEKVQADDHNMFKGLSPSHTYELTKNIEHSMARLDKGVVKMRLNAAANVADRVLPNGQHFGG